MWLVKDCEGMMIFMPKSTCLVIAFGVIMILKFMECI